MWNEPGRLRKIYDLHGFVYVASQRYICRDKAGHVSHKLVATDEGLLQQVRLWVPLPFRLTHRCGITVELEEHIIHRYVIMHI